MRGLNRLFGLSERRTTVGAEVMGGLTTFMVMAYIIFVNPAILSFAGIKELVGQGPAFAPTLDDLESPAGIVYRRLLTETTSACVTELLKQFRGEAPKP